MNAHTNFYHQHVMGAGGASEQIADDHGVIALIKARGKKIKAGPLLAAAPLMLAELRDILEFATTERVPLREQEITSIRELIRFVEAQR
jgi:hypothetical protein